MCFMMYLNIIDHHLLLDLLAVTPIEMFFSGAVVFKLLSQLSLPLEGKPFSVTFLAHRLKAGPGVRRINQHIFKPAAQVCLFFWQV